MLKIAKETFKAFRCGSCEKTFYNTECLIFSIFTKRERPTMILCETCSLNLASEVKKLVETKNPKYWKPI